MFQPYIKKYFAIVEDWELEKKKSRTMHKVQKRPEDVVPVSTENKSEIMKGRMENSDAHRVRK